MTPQLTVMQGLLADATRDAGKAMAEIGHARDAAAHAGRQNETAGGIKLAVVEMCRALAKLEAALEVHRAIPPARD